MTDAVAEGRAALVRKRAALRARRALAADLAGFEGTYTFESLSYAVQPTKQGPVTLMTDLYRPVEGADWPVVIWLHSGGFWTGTRRNRSHRLLAAHFVRHGYAVAVPDYRLQKPNGLLSLPIRRLSGALFAESERTGDPMQPLFRRHAALAVVDDCAAMAGWLLSTGPGLGLGVDKGIVWGGSSAGGISALNALFLLPHLGVPAPRVTSALVTSGGFAYGDFAKPGLAPVLALHNPADVQVPVGSIRALKDRLGGGMTLLESESLPHGGLALTPEEDAAASVARLVAFDRAARG